MAKNCQRKNEISSWGKKAHQLEKEREVRLDYELEIKFYNQKLSKKFPLLTRKNGGEKSGYEPRRDSWTLDASAGCTTQAHRPTDDCVSRRRFRLKNHSHRNERNPKG